MKQNTLRLCSILCAVLMLALLLCQLMPFWTLNGETISLQEYIWFCSEHAEVSAYLTGIDAQFNVNNFVTGPIIVLVVAVVGFFGCLIKPKKIWGSIASAICGLVGVFIYLTDAALQSGSFWILHLLLCVAVLALAVWLFFLQYKTKEPP